MYLIYLIFENRFFKLYTTKPSTITPYSTHFLQSIIFLNSSLGTLRFGINGDGDYGYYKGDDTFIPFKSGGLNTLAGGQSNTIPAGVKTAFLLVGYVTSYYGATAVITGDNYISHEQIARADVPTNGQTAGSAILYRINLTGEEGILNINISSSGTSSSCRRVYSLVY